MYKLFLYIKVYVIRSIKNKKARLVLAKPTEATVQHYAGRTKLWLAPEGWAVKAQGGQSTNNINIYLYIYLYIYKYIK